MEHKVNLMDLLTYINPSDCDYQEWTTVGMALKHEGYPVSAWEDWSAGDSRRYHSGECERKWETFQEDTARIVTGGTIYQMATERGYSPDNAGRELSWDDEITAPGVVVPAGWVEDRDIQTPTDWHPGKEIARYIEALFEPGEAVGYVTRSRLDEEKQKYIPADKGTYSLTAGEILEKISKYKDDVGAALGDYDKKAGAWIRFNPLDGNGVRNNNVTEYRYALVESDSVSVEKQNAIIRELELPVACLVYSGGKSLHAIVHIDASDYKEYQKRVEYLYSICAKNGLEVDTQNKNPSRLSRMPGCMRGDKKQFLVDTNIGKSGWNEWKEWIEAINDDLPEFEELSDSWENMPELADELISGVLRKGHKMLVAGPSKAGKSFFLIELCIAVAEGRRWCVWDCKQGQVLYVNLELDRASCLHRFKDVYEALGYEPRNLDKIDIWNLRGRSVPLDKLAPMLIRRAKKRGYLMVVIDPIYKVITGDENSAEQMARFCNQFDKICTELGCAVVYCHHHSKGAQGGKKSMDRASGSGVFARDPDAQIDMIELEPPKEAIAREKSKATFKVCMEYLKETRRISDAPPAALTEEKILEYCKTTLEAWRFSALENRIAERETIVGKRSAWRIEATLREFENFKPIDIWFEHPIHMVDKTGLLEAVQPEVDMPPQARAAQARSKNAEQKRSDTVNNFAIKFSELADFQGRESVPARELAEAVGVKKETLLGWFDDGKKANGDLKDGFEKFENPSDGLQHIRRKGT